MNAIRKTLAILSIGKNDDRSRRLLSDTLRRKPIVFQPIAKTVFAPQRVDALRNDEQNDSAKPAKFFY
ncbi:MAG: hypothetical protein ACI31D_04505 [Candidatus Limisoma sp.]